QIALQRQPAMPETHYNLGLTLARLGRYDEAASHYREALALTPANALAHYSFGALLVGRGEQNEGVAHLRRALALQPGWSEPRAMLERFEAAH
ncbi:MAG TPA: tetratricopeptide repeat protein, partial [Polyangiales bacterium]|nr:tetratricopeptide repeat protein [Polyangiales bacterium]